jgi:hypothetical protein
LRIAMGSHLFDVTIPILWGSRAVLEGADKRLWVIELAGKVAKLEIVGDAPAPGVRYAPQVDGFAVLGQDGIEIYAYSPKRRRLTSSHLGLPDCEVTAGAIKVGTNVFSGGSVTGYGVGIAVTEHSISMGAPLPEGLAALVVDAP